MRGQLDRQARCVQDVQRNVKYLQCIEASPEYSDYCGSTNENGLNIGKEAEERRGERMAGRSAGVDTAVGGARGK